MALATLVTLAYIWLALGEHHHVGSRQRADIYIFGITYHRQHFHESQQIDEHDTGRGHTELHLEERDRALAIAPDGHQDEQGGSALEEAAGAAGYHEDGATGRVVGRGLEMQLSKGGKQLAIQTSSETKRNDGQSRPNAGAKKATEY